MGTSTTFSGCAPPPPRGVFPPPILSMEGEAQAPLPLPRSGWPSARRGAGGTSFLFRASATSRPLGSWAIPGTAIPPQNTHIAELITIQPVKRLVTVNLLGKDFRSFCDSQNTQANVPLRAQKPIVSNFSADFIVVSPGRGET